MQLHIFQEPLHAVIVIVFGVVFFGIATCFLLLAQQRHEVDPSQLGRTLRYDPFILLRRHFEGTSAEEAFRRTQAEGRILFAAVSRGFQLTGALIAVLGLVGLITSIAKNLV
jgi:hypothetical protein